MPVQPTKIRALSDSEIQHTIKVTSGISDTIKLEVLLLVKNKVFLHIHGRNTEVSPTTVWLTRDEAAELAIAIINAVADAPLEAHK